MIGNTDESIKWYEDYLGKTLNHRDWTMGMINLAYLYRQKRDYSQSIKILTTIIEKYPKSAEAMIAHYSLLTFLSELNEYQKVLDECDKIIGTYQKEQQIVVFAMFKKSQIYELKKIMTRRLRLIK